MLRARGACYKDGTSGVIYAFQRNGTSWEERVKISIGKSRNWFGRDISISGNYAVVCAPLFNAEEGVVYIYNCITDLSLPVEPASSDKSTFGGEKIRHGITSVDASQPALREFRLLQNYTNPFNPETWIPYQLGRDSNVSIKIHTPSGQLMRTLDLGNMPVGIYTEKTKAAYWDGTNDSGEPVASGVYFYTIQTGDNYSATKKMVVER